MTSIAPPTRPSLVTLRAFSGRAVFQDPELADAVFARATHHPATLAACLLPERLQWLLRDGWDVTETVGRFRSFTTCIALEHGYSGRLWQRSFSHHLLPSVASTRAVGHFVANTPVREALVAQRSAYPWQTLCLDSLPVLSGTLTLGPRS